MLSASRDRGIKNSNAKVRVTRSRVYAFLVLNDKKVRSGIGFFCIHEKVFFFFGKLFLISVGRAVSDIKSDEYCRNKKIS